MVCNGRPPRCPRGGGCRGHRGQTGISRLGRVLSRGLPLASSPGEEGPGCREGHGGRASASPGLPPQACWPWEAAASMRPLTGAGLTRDQDRTRGPC